MTTDLGEARRLLASVFGFAAFRPGQEEIVAAVLAGENLLAIMPTGSGKSLCYQLPAIMGRGLSLVISPLIALMRDQVHQLRALGIEAASLNSGNDSGTNRDTIAGVTDRRLRLLYAAPERLAQKETLALLRGAGVARLVIDEAHCVSQWGHDFRPEYLGLARLAEDLGRPQILAFTATADATTRADVAAKLFGAPPLVFLHGFDRPNLRLAMQPKRNAGRQIERFVKDHQGASGIVYCATRRRTEEVAGLLAGEGHRALPYHAGMEADARRRNQDVFQREDGVVMAATIAFGMGIDKPDVRFVAHADLPGTIESYYQEIGRAGRDGLPADTLTLYGLADIRFRRMQIDTRGAPDEHKRVEHRRLDALVALCEAPRCRRQILLHYFGETSDACGNCDLCLDGAELYDGTVEAQKAMSAILRTGERFGTVHLVHLLRGEETEKITRYGHARLPTFGVGRERDAETWRATFRQLYAAGLIALDDGGIGCWHVTPSGRDVLRGRGRVSLRIATMAKTVKRKRTREAAVTHSADADLLARLKALRHALAKAANVPAYVVFPDRTLEEMAARRPTTLEGLAEIHGVGRAKLARWGAAFLAALSEEG
ncbi:MAG: DNA helicase RecQ, partial [Alphaproteobacteria bacterium]|nr:DNA helicase RecQ [Alphaproteobacteria bacterium]